MSEAEPSVRRREARNLRVNGLVLIFGSVALGTYLLRPGLEFSSFENALVLFTLAPGCILGGVILGAIAYFMGVRMARVPGTVKQSGGEGDR